MGISNIRKGVTQAHFNESLVNLVVGELAIVAVATGINFESWYIGGGTLLGLLAGLYIPVLNVVLALALSAGWGAIGYVIGTLFSTDASYVICGLAFLCGLGAHLGAIEWAKDVSDTEDRNI